MSPSLLEKGNPYTDNSFFPCTTPLSKDHWFRFVPGCEVNYPFQRPGTGVAAPAEGRRGPSPGPGEWRQNREGPILGQRGWPRRPARKPPAMGEARTSQVPAQQGKPGQAARPSLLPQRAPRAAPDPVTWASNSEAEPQSPLREQSSNSACSPAGAV